MVVKILEVSKSYLPRIGPSIVRSAHAVKPNTNADPVMPICVCKPQKQPMEDVFFETVLAAIFASTDIVNSLCKGRLHICVTYYWNYQ